MAWHADHTPGADGSSVSLVQAEGAPHKRRTLSRVLAAAVAIAAISPLFAADPNGCARGSVPARPFHQNLPSPPLEFHHH